MSVLAVGLSHRSAPVEVLESAAAGVATPTGLLAELLSSPDVEEGLLLSTCNRVEVYAEVSKFHGGLRDVSAVLAQASGLSLDTLASHLYVHYEERAVQHLFAVACGLDSMVVGEAQILGQLRAAYRGAREAGSVGRALETLVQQALRVGKRVHSETDIDSAAASLVGFGLELAAEKIGPLSGRSAVVVGAGSMGALATSALRRAGVSELTVVNRSLDSARRLAAAVTARPLPLGRLRDALVTADLLVSATGATGTVIRAEDVIAALQQREQSGLFVLDLALPHDVEANVGTLPGVTLLDLDGLRVALEAAPVVAEVERVRRIVQEEVSAFLALQRSARVAPTVVALRSRAEEVVAAELERLDARLPALDERTRVELASTVHRVVDKLLHAPTVRVKELAEAPGGDTYAEALRELFGLDPAAAAAVTRAEPSLDDEVLS